MAVAPFDTLKFANTLKAAGVPDKQAEAEAAAFAEVLQINLKELATKEDLALLGKDLRREISDVRREIGDARDELKREIGDVRDELKREIGDVRADTKSQFDTFRAKMNGDFALLRWMLGAVLAALIGILIRLFLYRTPI